MGRTGRFAGRGTGIIAIDLVPVPVVHAPFIPAPLCFIGKLLPGIFDFPVLCTQLLSQFRCACGTIFHTTAAGHAVLLCHTGTIGRAGHIGGIKQLGGTQAVADTDGAVADGKNLFLSVNIGDLMDIAVILRPLQDFHDFLIIDIAAFPCLHEIIGHVADADAQVILQIAGSLSPHTLLAAAGTGAYRIFILVFVQPVGNMFDIGRLLPGGNGFFHRDDMHADTRPAVRHHRSHLFQRQPGHLFKEIRQLRMLLHLLCIHHHKFRTAGHKHGKHILLMTIFILPVVFDQADNAHLLKKLFRTLHALFAPLRNPLGRSRNPHLHSQSDLRHLIRYHTSQPPVFRIRCGYLNSDPVRYLLTELQY